MEKLAQEQESYRQKTNWRWKTPPVLIGLNCKVSHEKSSLASFFTTAKVTSQILLDQISHAYPFLNWALDRVSLSGSVEGAGEETYCKANENCSSEALLLREKNSLFWNCAPYMYVARKVSIYMLYKYDVLMTSALPFTATFFGRFEIRMSRLIRV